MRGDTNESANSTIHIDMSVAKCMDKSKRPQIEFEVYLNMIKQLEADHADIANNTKLMFTKFRKIYYDTHGWNDELIRGTKDISAFKSIPKGMESKDHIVKLKNGDLYDIAHIFAIVDAGNHDGYFTPLPSFLMFLHGLFPTVKSRLTASGWLGDLSSDTGQFFLQYKAAKKIPTLVEKQKVVETYSPCDKMISNADALVIINNYKVAAEKGMKVSEILIDFYETGGKGEELRKKRFSLFADYLGLKGWQGSGFSNEKDWLKYYSGQLKTCTAFYLFFFRKKLSTVVWSSLIWLGFYKKEVGVNQVLNAFVVGLKSAINTEG